MFDDPKPIASLGPALLARKGGARPAMRPQFNPLMASAALNGSDTDMDDLGWNDMGGEDAQTPPRFAAHSHDQALELSAFDSDEVEEIEEDELANEGAYGSLLTPAQSEDDGQIVDDSDAREQVFATPEPEVRRQQRNLATAVAQRTKALRRKTATEGRRAAFTLRLDAERHLKLRLTATVRGVSAQQLVTQALDEFLANIPEIDSLAAHVKRA